MAILARFGYNCCDLNMVLFLIFLVDRIASLETASHSSSIFKSLVDDRNFGVSDVMIFGIINYYDVNLCPCGIRLYPYLSCLLYYLIAFLQRIASSYYPLLLFCVIAL